MKSVLLSLVVTTTLFLGNGFAHAGVEADMHIKGSQTENSAHEVTAHVYFEGDKFRMDMNPSGNPEQKVSIIMDQKSGKSYSVMHAQKKYSEIPYGQNEKDDLFLRGEMRNVERLKKEGYTVNKVGQEKVEGYLCSIYEIKGGAKQDLKEGKVWIAEALDGLAIQMNGKNKDASTMEMKFNNIQKKTLAAGLFQPPPDYQVFAMPKMGRGQEDLAKEIQRIQKLPPEERQKQMQALQGRLQKPAETGGEPYQN